MMCGPPKATILASNMQLKSSNPGSLDENGKEFYRHEGYFPEEELVKV
jgi:hypothetical protein